MVRACSAEQDAHIGNRLLRLEWRSDSASAVAQGYLGGPETPIRAGEGSGLAEISAIQGVAPPHACRRVSLDIDFFQVELQFATPQTTSKYLMRCS